MGRISKGFTLLELLATIAIVVLLAALLFPLTSKIKESANRAKCAGNLKSLGSVWTSYAADHDGYFPSNGYSENETFGNWTCMYGSVINELFQGQYASDPDIFFCPEYKFTRYPQFGKEEHVPGGLYYFSYAIYSGQLYAERFNDWLGNKIPPARRIGQSSSKIPLMFDETMYYPSEKWEYVNHYDKKNKKAYGGNALYGDGHVSWRPFPEMIKVMNAGGGYDRYY